MRNVKNVMYLMLESNIKLSIAVAAGGNLAIFVIKLSKIFGIQDIWKSEKAVEWCTDQ